MPYIVGEPEPIDFTWFFFIGKTKLGLTTKEVGRLTFRMFGKLYKHYKDTFDIEMRLFNANKTYSEINAEAEQEKEWF